MRAKPLVVRSGGLSGHTSAVPVVGILRAYELWLQNLWGRGVESCNSIQDRNEIKVAIGGQARIPWPRKREKKELCSKKKRREGKHTARCLVTRRRGRGGSG